MKILVIGGAGYIGSHVVKELMSKGHKITVFDNLSTGLIQNLFKENDFIAGDIMHKDDLEKAFSRGFDAFIHLAAWKAVGESMEFPEKYSENNITGTLNIINAAVSHNCKNMVFSSTAAVYGYPNYLPVDEKAEFIQFIVNHALDDMTGCCSPVRIEVYFSIAVCKWYANITFTEKQMTEISKTYDLLEENGVIDQIISTIPEDEIEFMKELVNDTVSDIARYNSSAAGIIQAMTANAGGLDSQITEILDKIKNGENLETLAVIKDVVGKD